MNSRDERLKKQKKYYRQNKKDILKYLTEWRHKNPNYSKENDLMRKYRMSISDYNLMLKQQENKCSICKKQFKKSKDAYVDHSHRTNKIRDILCRNCNTALGHVYENEEILKSMIQYLKKHG